MFDEKMRNDIDTAITGQYHREINIDSAWVSFRHPDYPLESASRSPGRFNISGNIAYYMASGECCGQMEVSGYIDRTPCEITYDRIKAFDLVAFAEDYGYGDIFIQPHSEGGWEIPQEVSEYLTEIHSVSGIFYNSSAMHQKGQKGCCLAVLANSELSGIFDKKQNDFD